ncbi:MAG: phosphotransferase family protein [Gammaproteobacteria bacterium]|nr:phosphotransferase family protein [Gammaproteobacteria bacterium]
MKNPAVLDREALAPYLEKHVSGFGTLHEVEKFPGGQSNPTFLLSGDGGKFVLRRQPPGELLKSAHAVDREFRVIDALQNTDVPVPRAIHLCEDRDVIGSMFYLMSYADGTVYWDPSLPEFDNAGRAAVHQQLIDVLAAIHNVNIDAVGLSDYGKGKDYFARQIALWIKQYRAAETDTLASVEKIIEWLPANMPPDSENITLLHGDYRLDNVMFARHEPRAIAVLDWELSTLGNPVADIAYYCIILRMPGAGAVKGLAGVDLESLAIPNEQQVIERYCSLRGIDGIPHWNFYLAFSFFRLASIIQGVYKRALMGNASNERSMEMGKNVQALAELALHCAFEPAS